MKVLLVTLLLTVASAHAQTQAAFGIYGSSCATPVQSQPATITNVGLPRLGQTFSVVYQGEALASTASLTPILFVSLGPAGIPAGSAVVPLPQQPTSCWVLIDPLLILGSAAAPFDPSTGTFRLDFPFAVPNLPALMNQNLYFQFLMPYVQCGIVPPCTLEAIGTTEGAQATIGV